MHTLLRFVFSSMNQQGILYCLLRDYDELAHPSRTREIDILVAKKHLGLLEHLLVQIGFFRLRVWGYEPHRFFLLYDEQSDSWLKLDVVTEISYGNPVGFLRTALATGCLVNRRLRDSVQIPRAEDELITLLLHCVLDKGFVAQRHQTRLRALCHQVEDETYLSALVALYWPLGESWTQLANSIDLGEWEKLISKSNAVAQRLRSRDRIGTLLRYGRGRVWRKLHSWYGWLRPPGRSVALLAADGAGKSTIASQLHETFYFPISTIYMGLYGRGTPSKKRVTGLNFLWRLLRQWRRYLTARFEMAQGRWVVFDRYSYDALLAMQSARGRIRRQAYLFMAFACPAPQLTLVLDAPVELLVARKGEQGTSILEKQRQQYLELATRVPRLVIVDAAQEIEWVRRRVTALLWQSYGQR